MKNNKKFDEASKRRLQKIIKQKLKTSFIGAIAAFEEDFGYLWGHELEDGEQSEEQDQFYEAWEAVRNRILNNGNNQLRALLQEVDNHEVHWNRYQVEFKIGEYNE